MLLKKRFIEFIYFEIIGNGKLCDKYVIFKSQLPLTGNGFGHSRGQLNLFSSNGY